MPILSSDKSIRCPHGTARALYDLADSYTDIRHLHPLGVPVEEVENGEFKHPQDSEKSRLETAEGVLTNSLLLLEEDPSHLPLLKEASRRVYDDITEMALQSDSLRSSELFDRSRRRIKSWYASYGQSAIATSHSPSLIQNFHTKLEALVFTALQCRWPTVSSIEWVLEQIPIAYNFGAEQTTADRAIALSGLSPDVQMRVKQVIIEMIISRLDVVESDSKRPQPLSYYMACKSEQLTPGDEAVRRASAVWLVELYSYGSLQLCAVSGADRTIGGGVAWKLGREETFTIYHNTPKGAVPARPEYEDALRNHALTTNESDEDSEAQ